MWARLQILLSSVFFFFVCVCVRVYVAVFFFICFPVFLSLLMTV